jgi:predicted acetyltransferase
VDGKYAGFILINKDFKIIDDPEGHTVAEFFVMRKYRQRGIGAFAVRAILEVYPGSWEISQVMANPAAVGFWNKVVEEYTGGEFEKKYRDQNGLKKQILLFNNEV